MPREPYPPLSLQTPVVSVFEMEGVMVSHVMFGKPAFGKKKSHRISLNVTGGLHFRPMLIMLVGM